MIFDENLRYLDMNCQDSLVFLPRISWIEDLLRDYIIKKKKTTKRVEKTADLKHMLSSHNFKNRVLAISYSIAL
jgi:hypothetical protein